MSCRLVRGEPGRKSFFEPSSCLSFIFFWGTRKICQFKSEHCQNKKHRKNRERPLPNRWAFFELTLFLRILFSSCPAGCSGFALGVRITNCQGHASRRVSIAATATPAAVCRGDSRGLGTMCDRIRTRRSSFSQRREEASAWTSSRAARKVCTGAGVE